MGGRTSFSGGLIHIQFHIQAEFLTYFATFGICTSVDSTVAIKYSLMTFCKCFVLERVLMRWLAVTGYNFGGLQPVPRD